jgi:aspartate/methionine/tyrosine aminotransferase
MPALREAIAHSMTQDNGTAYDADEIIVTAGAQEAMSCVMLGLINPGDEVIVPIPGYNTYHSAIDLAGGVTVFAETTFDEDFSLKASHIEKVITPKTRMVCLISPNNPTATVVPPEEVVKIARLCVAHDLILVSDEIYAKLVYDNHRVVSPASLPGMHERTITINGFSKAYAMTGWRVGWLAAPRALIPAIADIHHTVAICATASSQHAALAAISGPQDCVAEMLGIYAERRRVLMQGLDRLGLPYATPGGGMYIYARVTDTGFSLDEFCLKALREARVQVSPSTFFGPGGDGFVRIALLRPVAEIREAVTRLEKVFGTRA